MAKREKPKEGQEAKDMEYGILHKLIRYGVLTIAKIEKLGYRVDPSDYRGLTEEGILTVLLNSNMFELELLSDIGFMVTRAEIATSHLTPDQITALEMLGMIQEIEKPQAAKWTLPGITSARDQLEDLIKRASQLKFN